MYVDSLGLSTCPISWLMNFDSISEVLLVSAIFSKYPLVYLPWSITSHTIGSYNWDCWVLPMLSIGSDDNWGCLVLFIGSGDNWGYLMLFIGSDDCLELFIGFDNWGCLVLSIGSNDWGCLVLSIGLKFCYSMVSVSVTCYSIIMDVALIVETW